MPPSIARLHFHCYNWEMPGGDLNVVDKCKVCFLLPKLQLEMKVQSIQSNRMQQGGYVQELSD